MADKIKKLVVFSHKLVWRCPDSPTGYATDGGFAFHMKAISEIFESTTLVVPVSDVPKPEGEVYIQGNNIKIYPVKNISGSGMKRKLRFPSWLARNIFSFRKLIRNADAVHAPIPSDMGTIGMVLAKMMDKPLFVRYCGNWLVIKTRAERFWQKFMEKHAGGKNVFLTTGVESTPPSRKNNNISWIFSSSLTREELEQLRQNLPVLDPANPRLIIVCRQEEEKGTREVIKAVKLLQSELPGIHLDVVGDGGALASFKTEADSLDLNKNIRFHGKVNHDRVLELMQQAHLFCYPTRSSEGFPKVVLEGLASGLPVLGTPVSAIRHLLSSGGGVILEDNRPETLADAIRTVCAAPATYSNMQVNAMDAARAYSLEGWRDTIHSHMRKAWKNI